MVELSDQQIMPSATYIDKDFLSLTGDDAINMYISANRGRTVELAGELLGEERTGTGDNNGPDNDNETNKVYGHAVHDFGLPGRLFRGTKRLLSSRSNEKIMIFGRPFRLVALITPIPFKGLQGDSDACEGARRKVAKTCVTWSSRKF